jgi:subtilisin family serine protease
MKRKEFMDIMSTDISMFDVEKWDKLDLFHNYDRLKTYITLKLGTEYFDFFARPKTGRKNHEVVWQSDLFDAPPVPLSSLTGDEYTRYKARLDEKTGKLKELIRQIEEEQKDVPRWSQLLEKAMLYGGDNYVFCGDGKITVAAWSMKPGQQYIHNPGGREINKKDIIDSGDTPENNSPPVVNDADNTDKGNIVPPADNLPPVVNNADNTDEENTVTPADNPPPVETGTDDTDGGNTVTPEKPTPPSPLPHPRKWWKWLLYILAALFLCLLLFGLLRRCSESAVPVLPEQPGMMPPIDPGDVGYDDDSILLVVANRLNILLEDEDIEGFARDFKKAYPGDEYRIVYYDTIVRRLQILIPKEEKSIIRIELPQKLPQYSFIIYDESMFNSGYRPNDPAMNDRAKSWYLEAVKAPQAWDITLGDSSVTVAIVDDGFDLAHTELRERVYLPYNAVSHDRTLFPQPSSNPSGEISDHGTHTSGTAIGEANNGEGLSGIAPGCKYMPVQVGDRNGQMSITAIMDGLLYAIYNGADVVNLSLGTAMPSIEFQPEYIQRIFAENMFLEAEQVWNEVYKIAEKHNTVIVYAAGNDNVLTAVDPMNRSDYCIHVSALDTDLSKADFSNWGEQSTVSAPGVAIYSSSLGDRYVFMNGTSMAAPIVTGGVALIKSINKNISAREVIRLLQTTGLPVASSRRMGNLIQLDRALAAASGRTFPTDCRDIARRIDSLTRVIDELRRQCLRYAPADTMKLPEIIEKPETLNGRWQSTTDLYNDKGERVSVYLDFDVDNKCGTFSLVENSGRTFTAPIKINITGNSLEITQNEYACCDDGYCYGKYTFSCRADKNGKAECVATNVNNKLNKVIFNLVKIS